MRYMCNLQILNKYEYIKSYLFIGRGSQCAGGAITLPAEQDDFFNPRNNK